MEIDRRMLGVKRARFVGHVTHAEEDNPNEHASRTSEKKILDISDAGIMFSVC
jgi:hypothetical protein